MRKLIALPIFLCLVFPQTGMAQSIPLLDTIRVLDSIRTVRKQKIHNFTDSRYPIWWRIDTLKKIPTELRGANLSMGLTQTDPVEAAYEFLEQNKELFGIKNVREELKVEGMSFKKYGGMVVLKQFYNGVPVLYGEIIARFSTSKNLYAIESRFQPEIDAIDAISIIPSVDSTSAIEIAKRDLNYKGDRADSAFARSVRISKPLPPPYLILFPHDNRCRLAWVLQIDAASPHGIWKYFIDANTGNVLNKENRLSFDRKEIPKK